MKSKKELNFFEHFANLATHFTGSSTAFIIAASIVIVWGLTGPIFNYSETWQLVINTGTTIVTFLMVFLIQKTQNKDSKAIHLKLNEIIAAIPKASNRMVEVEDLSEEELDHLHEFYSRIAKLAQEEGQLKRTHNKETALKSHMDKLDKENGSKETTGESGSQKSIPKK